MLQVLKWFKNHSTTHFFMQCTVYILSLHRLQPTVDIRKKNEKVKFSNPYPCTVIQIHVLSTIPTITLLYDQDQNVLLQVGKTFSLKATLQGTRTIHIS